MKQQKGKDYKMTRQGTDEDRKAKKRLRGSVKASVTKGEFGEDKLIASSPMSEKGESGK